MLILYTLIWTLTILSESMGKRRRNSASVDYFGPGFNQPAFRRRHSDPQYLRMKNRDPVFIAQKNLSNRDYFGPGFNQPAFRRRHSDPQYLRMKNRDPVFIAQKSLRIRGGNITDSKNFPYMAAVIINGRLWCAGALVDINWVVTAAHCLNYVIHVSPLKSLGKYVKVRVGSSRAHDGGKVLDVVGAVRHPKFEEEPVPHSDVALLKLSENVPMTEISNVIKIYEGNQATDKPYAQSFVVVSGWGASRGSETSFRDHTSDLMQARLKVRTQNYCRDAYQLVNGLRITNDFFCASLRNGTRDACLFDAGAPAVQENRLMGIMSFGPDRCGHEYQPAVFIKAGYFRDFVKATISSYKTNDEFVEALAEANNDVPKIDSLLGAVNPEEEATNTLV